MPKHTDLTAAGQIFSSPVQMGCTRCLVYLVPCHLKLLQEQLSDAFWLEVFDLNPRRPLLKPHYPQILSRKLFCSEANWSASQH